MNKGEPVNETIDTLRAQLQRQAETQKLLLEITQRIASSVTLEEMLPVIVSAVQRGVNADAVCITHGDQADAVGTLADTLKHAGAKLDELIAKRSTIEIADVSAASANADLSAVPLEGVKALMLLPLIAQDERHGLLSIAYRQPHPFTDEERTFLAVAAGQTAIAIENTQTFNAVQQSQEQLAAILASTVDPVIVIDAQEAIVLLNPAAERALGVQAKTISGKPVSEVLTAEILLDLLRNISGVDAAEWQNENGQTYAPHVSDIKAEDQSPRGRVLILRDITRYKTLHANQNEFVSTVSHDLRSPLTYMQGYASMLPMVGELTSKQKEHVDKIISGIAQMTDLIDKILDAGRLDPETGYYELARDACDVVKMTHDVVSTHLQAAEKKKQTLTADVDAHLPMLNLDELMLRRALNNLVDNAIKYTPEGGSVTVSAKTKEHDLILSVRDTGLGISEENAKRLFDRFRRIRRKEHQRIKGIGLGLFIVKSVAQRHGGDAWVESKEGVGSTFFIRLPMDGTNLVGAEAKKTESGA